jgi:hypothetical protein
LAEETKSEHKIGSEMAMAGVNEDHGFAGAQNRRNKQEKGETEKYSCRTNTLE